MVRSPGTSPSSFRHTKPPTGSAARGEVAERLFGGWPWQRLRLPGGLRLVLLPRLQMPTVTCLVLIGVGARYESRRQAGLSHFLEHMFFKGTERRPSTRAIAEAIDNVGGEFNAFTGEEYTGYYVKLAAAHINVGLEVVSDILLRSLFPEPEVERERGVIMEEIRMYTDTPMRHIHHLWSRALFGAHPLGQRVDGTRETVQRLQRRDFLRYARRHYHTGNAVVVIAGQCVPRHVVPLIKKLFGPLPRGAATAPRAAPTRVPAKHLVWEHRATLDQTHVMVGAAGLRLGDPRRYAAGLLAIILGGGMSSRLFLEVRERHGLAYAVHTSHDSFTDAGSFVTQVGARTDKALLAVRLVLAEYDRVMEAPVPAAELRKAKEMARGQLLLELEETNALAAFAGGQEILEHRILTPREIMARVEAVTASELQRVARALLKPARRAVAVLGPRRSDRPFASLMRSAL